MSTYALTIETVALLFHLSAEAHNYADRFSSEEQQATDDIDREHEARSIARDAFDLACQLDALIRNMRDTE